MYNAGTTGFLLSFVSLVYNIHSDALASNLNSLLHIATVPTVSS